MSETSNCLFCRIVADEIPADVFRSTPWSLAFRDIDPQEPTHVLVIPRAHHDSVGSLVAEEPDLASRLLADADAVARDEGLRDYRLVTNTGSEAGQSVFHVHLHVLGGRPMRWPPG
jgi:histidine triad (HIT) family protein